MGKDYMRIDDRLVHGQIVTAWCGTWKIGEIVAIDDKLAVNKMLQSIMLMGIPRNIKAHVVTMEEAKKLFAESSDLNRLFIARFPSDLAHIREEIKKCELVNIGNAASRPDTKYMFAKSGGTIFYASDADVDLFDEIVADGVNIVYQSMPNMAPKDWQTLRKTVKR